jgi:hypothetical protein
MPAGNSLAFWQPVQASTTWWQLPPLNWQPFLPMKKHSTPCFTFVQTMGITSFPYEIIELLIIANNSCLSIKNSEPLLENEETKPALTFMKSNKRAISGRAKKGLKVALTGMKP